MIYMKQCCYGSEIFSVCQFQLVCSNIKLSISHMSDKNNCYLEQTDNNFSFLVISGFVIMRYINLVLALTLTTTQC